ncbi:MAG: glycerate kinase [Solirubrobacterales bacterium]|nr:glycerate kinase [Solirubrobacterales bacterium]MBV9050747.1 glycerate kinase [Solirubrobacterales bacterium]
MPAVTGIPDTILIAPDSFKGTFSSFEVADTLAAGLTAGGWKVDPCPVADGGEGTLEVLRDAFDAELVTAEVTDPLGRRIEAAFGLGERAAIIATSAASGLGLIEPSERDPIAASTTGTGELISAAIDAGAGTVYLGVGGSATTDGGAGAVKAIRAGGGLRGARLVVLSDVRTPFEEAARVFGPQKGADPDQVGQLSKRLHAMARRLERDPRGVPMTGAAGGLSGGLWAALDAELVAGAAFVLDALEFDRRMRAARAVVTGEGKLDLQSLGGKLISEVATRARQAGVPCHAVVGTRELDSFGARILDLQVVLEASNADAIRSAGRELGDLI